MKWPMHLFLTAAVLALLGTGVALVREPARTPPRAVVNAVVTTTTDPLIGMMDEVSKATDSAIKACSP